MDELRPACKQEGCVVPWEDRPSGADVLSTRRLYCRRIGGKGYVPVGWICPNGHAAFDGEPFKSGSQSKGMGRRLYVRRPGGRGYDPVGQLYAGGQTTLLAFGQSDRFTPPSVKRLQELGEYKYYP